MTLAKGGKAGRWFAAYSLADDKHCMGQPIRITADALKLLPVECVHVGNYGEWHDVSLLGVHKAASHLEFRNSV